jgi:ABC-type transporter MlaC component
VALTWKKVVGAGMVAVAQAAVNDSSIPQEQKTSINQRVDQVVKDWKDGKVSMEQLGEVIEAIAQSPVMPLAMVGLADRQYVEPSAMTKDEKDAGRRSLQRFARGVYEKKIPQSATDELLKTVQVTDGSGNRQMKQVLTPEELRAFLDLAKKHADDAKMPDEAFEINYADEINKAIDKVLAGPGAGSGG